MRLRFDLAMRRRIYVRACYKNVRAFVSAKIYYKFVRVHCFSILPEYKEYRVSSGVTF